MSTERIHIGIGPANEETPVDPDSLNRLIDSASAQEYQRSNTIYYIFNSIEDKNKARRLIRNHYQEDSRFQYLDLAKLGDDPENSLGLKLVFTKSEKNEAKNIKNFLEENNIEIKEENIYIVLDNTGTVQDVHQ
jgi:hypothetical protein